MNQIWFALAFAATWLNSQPAVTGQPVTVQFARALCGRTVTVSVDGKVEQTFAGKLGFRDQFSSWQSVCADVRSPVAQGEFFGVQAVKTTKAGGNYAKAGNIVARYFRAAQTPDQCAGLQIAVWEAIEDGGDEPGFLNGRFRVNASTAVLVYAQEYYGAANQPGDSLLLAAGGGGAGGGGGGGGGQSQLMPTTPP